MKTFFLFFLLSISLFVNAQPYTKCSIYMGDETTPHDRKHLNKIMLYNARGQMTWSKTFCDTIDAAAKDITNSQATMQQMMMQNNTACMSITCINSYNAAGLLEDSLFVKSNGDTTEVRFFYNGKGQLDSSNAVITLYVKRNKRSDTIQKRKEADYYYYDSDGKVVKCLQQRNAADGYSYYKHEYYYRKKFLSSFIKQRTDSEFFSSYKFHPDIFTDTGKWFAPTVTVKKFSKNGYKSKGFWAGNTDDKFSSTLTYIRDDQGRIIEEIYEQKQISEVVLYGYFPDRRVIKRRDVAPFWPVPQDYFYVYE